MKYNIIRNKDRARQLIGGTSRKDRLNGWSYKQLVQAFGEPTFPEASGDNKVRKEWVFERKSDNACFTIYAETHRVDNIPKIMGDMDLVDQDNRVWRYVIRYNENEDDLALYDKHRFGNRLIYGKRGDIL